MTTVDYFTSQIDSEPLDQPEGSFRQAVGIAALWLMFYAAALIF